MKPELYGNEMFEYLEEERKREKEVERYERKEREKVTPR